MAKKPARKSAVSPPVRTAPVKKPVRPVDPFLLWPLVALFLLAIGWFLYRQVVAYLTIGSGLSMTTVIPQGPRTKRDGKGVPNYKPTIVTYALPAGRMDTDYKGSLVVTDPDEKEKLTVTMGGFPLGVTKGDCKTEAVAIASAKTQVTCQITGTPKQAGSFMLTVSVTDSAGNTVRNDVPLSVGQK